jgi:hypothetical protein
MDDLDRLFQYLVNHLVHDAPQYLNRSFQVSELYQRIIPYRYHRDALGFGSADDYEAAMLRLLAGERHYASVDPEDAQKAMAREAQLPHPSHGAFREFAAATVTLQRDAVQRFTRSDVAYAPPTTPAEASHSFAPAFTEPAARPEPPVSPPPPPPAMTDAETVPLPPVAPPPASTPRSAFVFEPVEAVPGCPGCGEELPADRDPRFCPFCGLRIGVAGCRQCGEPLDPDWRYCCACGTRFDG